MWTAFLRVVNGIASVLVFTLIAATLALAADPIPPSQQLRASTDSPTYVAPYLRPMEKKEIKSARVVDKRFIGMSALVMGLTIADIESTQHCLGKGTCQELNPLMPDSRAGMYAVNIPVNALAMYVSYRLKASGHKTWWIAPIAISGAHGVGAAFVF